MTVVQAIETFSHYSGKDQRDFLVQFAHMLTILARGTYEAGGDGLTEPTRLRRLNETQHHILGFLLALLRQDSHRYPEEVLVRLMLEHEDDLELQHQLCQAFGRLTAQRAMTT